jgi:DNA-binding XRE family transcriptional regulator
METVQQIQPLFVNQQQAAALIGVTTRTILNWEKENRIHRCPQFKSPRYSVEQLKKLASAA